MAALHPGYCTVPALWPWFMAVTHIGSALFWFHREVSFIPSSYEYDLSSVCGLKLKFRRTPCDSGYNPEKG